MIHGNTSRPRPHSRRFARLGVLGKRWQRHRVTPLECLEERTCPSTMDLWVGGSGNWSDAANWSAGVPGPSDDVNLGGTAGSSYVITYSSGTSAVNSIQGGQNQLDLTGGSLEVDAASAFDGTLNLDGGTLVANAEVTLTGNNNWDNSTISGTGDVVNNGVMTIADDADGYLAVPWTNSGTLFISDEAQLSLTGSTFTNTTSGLIDIHDYSGPIVSTGSTTGTIDNAGTIRKSSGSNSNIDVSINNAASGVIDVESGTLNLLGGGDFLGANFVTQTGTVLNVSPDYGSFTFDGTYTGSGGGQVNFGGGYNPFLFLVGQSENTTFNFPAGLFQWQSQEIEVGAHTFTNAGTIGVGVTDGEATLVGTLTNTGTLELSLGLSLDNGTIQNTSTGLIDFPSDYGIASEGTDTVDNAGTIRKSGGTNNSTIQAVVNSTAAGVLDVESGTLNLLGGGDFLGANFVTQTGTVLNVSPDYGSFTFDGTYIGSGGGQVNFGGGYNPFLFLVGQSENTTFDFPAGLFQWQSQKIQVGAYTFTNAGTTGVGITNGAPTLIGMLTNTGTLELSSSSLSLDNGTIQNTSTGLIDFVGDYGIASEGTDIVDNAGTIQKSSGSNISHIDAMLNNAAAGILQVESGTLSVDGGGDFLGGDFETNPLTVLKFDNADDNPSLIFDGTYTGSGGGQVILGEAISVAQSEDTVFDFPQGMLYWYAATIQGGAAHNFTNTGDLTIGGTGAYYTYYGQTLAGTLQNAGTCNIASDNFNLSGGTFENLQSGTTVLEQGDTLISGTTGEPQIVLDNASAFDNAGQLTIPLQSGWSLEKASTLDNEATGTITVSEASGTTTVGSFLSIVGSSSTSRFTNEGMVTFSNASSALQLPFDNTGTLDVTGGQASFDTSITQISGGALTGGTWIAAGGAQVDFPADFTTNQADVTIDGATSQIFEPNPQTGTQTPWLPFAPATNTGAIHLLDGASMDTTQITNSGRIELGTASGIVLTQGGTFTQTAAGTLAIDIGGSPASGLLGTVSDDPASTAAAAVNLGGTLELDVVGGYGPIAGQAYPIIALHDGKVLGTFAQVVGPTQGTQPVFHETQNGTSVTVTVAATGADLAAANVTVPATAVAGQPVTITFGVTDVSSVASEGTWVDSVYLATGTTLDASSILLGRLADPGGIAAGQTVTRSLTALVPGVMGNLHVIVVVDSQDTTLDPNQANNTAVAGTVMAVSVPELTLGTPVTGTITAGEDLFYALDVPPGTTVNLSAALGAGDSAQLFTQYASLPTPSTYDQTSGDGTSAQQAILLPQSQSGAEYILLHALPGAGTSGTTFTLTATAVPFSLLSVSPAQAANSGSVTLDLTGSQFTTATTATLIGPGGTTVTGTTALESGSSLAATFNLSGLPVGSYTVQVATAGQTASLPGAFQVVQPAAGQPSEQVGGNVVFVMNVTSPIRPDQTGTIWISYTNAGQTDAPAPLMELSSDNAEFEAPGETAGIWFSNQILLMGLNPDLNGPAGVLPPGASGSFSITFLPLVFGPDVTSTFDLSTVSGSASTTAINWSSVLASQEPPQMTSATWNAVLQNFNAMAGSTSQAAQATLDADATTLAQNGDRVSLANQLFSYELGLAGNEIVQADYVGTMGPGVDDYQNVRVVPTDSSLQTLALETGSQTSYYQLDSTTGIYEGEPGDTTTLTANLTTSTGSGGAAEQQLAVEAHFADGSVQTFRSAVVPTPSDVPDPGLFAGLAVPIQTAVDPNGNITTYTYNASGELLSIADVFGTTQSFTYNSQNLVSSITNLSGTTFLTYDSTTDDLLKLITPSGTYQLQYEQSTNPALQNAVSAIIYPTGVQESFTYNALGQMVSDQLGSEAATTYSYTPSGAVTETDGDGVATTVSPNLSGTISTIVDGLGNVSKLLANPDTGLSQVTSANGATLLRTQDALGSTTQLVQPDGSTIDFSYQTGTTNVTQVTDPDGNTTSFTYDASGNPTSETNAAGHVESFSYDSAGNLVTIVDQMGQTFTNTYNGQGLLTSQKRPDGTSVSYTYNSAEMLTSVTDASGTTSFTYDAANNITSVTYPNGQSISYTYNAAEQRVRMATSDGYAVRYQYNGNGQLSALTDDSGNLIAAYQYDSAGRLIRQDNANGTATTYQYDADGRVVQLTNLDPEGNTTSFYDYVDNADGQETQVTSADGVTSFTYDVLGQLASVALPGGQTITYQYDSAGNRVSVTNNGATTTYTTNDLNQYVSAGTTTFQYDADGRLIGETSPSGTTTYSYNGLGQMTGQSGPAGNYTYQYDGLGNLIATTENGQTTTSLVDPTGLGNVIAQYNGSGQLVAQYTYGLGLTSRIDPTLGQSFYNFDADGNTVQLTGANGAVQDSYSYLPFGEVLQSTGSVANPFTYNGLYGVSDMGGGLYSMRSRVYDSALGRFTSMDPLGLDSGDTNLYRFAANSPLQIADPVGLTWLPPPGASAEGVSAFFNQLGFLPTTPAQVAYGDSLASQNGMNQLVNLVQNYYQESRWAQAALAEGRRQAANAALSGSSEAASGTAIADLGAAETAGAGEIGTAASGSLLADVAPPLLAGTIVAGLRQTRVLGWYTNLGDLIVSHYYSQVENPFPDNPSPLPDGSMSKNKHGSSTQHVSGDPNSIVGPAGYGAQGFIQPVGTFPYQVNFENEPTATAPAAQVVVTDQLDANLDWSTFQLGAIHFNAYTVAIPAGRTFYQTVVDATATLGVYVDVTASFNIQTGLATWTLTAINPVTLDLETSANLGLLPPDDSTGRGEGYVEYAVQPKAGAASGTAIDAQATVVFDTNAPISTAQIVNTIDSIAPTSSVVALPATVGASFPVSWSGTDNTGGSGIASYDIMVSHDGGPFTAWLTGTTQTSATYPGAYGQTYAFYAIATDNAGNVQPTPTAAQATTTTIATPLRVTSISPSSDFLTSLPNNQIVVTFDRALEGLVPNKSDGTGFASEPFAVMLIPSGPDGLATQKATGVFWSGPSGADDGDVPIPATAVYHVNTNGTSTITLTPDLPLAPDVYLITVDGVSDTYGDPLATDAAGDPGNVYASFDYRPTTATAAPTVTGVTTDDGTVTIANNRIAQPDTIGIAFSKPMDTYTINTSTVQLFEKGVSGALPAAVTYSPTTQSAYLTPETTLMPGATYYVSVATTVTDDQGFPAPGMPLAHQYVTSFSVSQAAAGTGTSPLTVVKTSPKNGTEWTAALGYGAITFSEPINPSSLGRFSAMLVPQTGSAVRGAGAYADVPVDAKLAFNPNTDQLIIVPTSILQNDTIYLFELSGIKATNGNTLAGTVYSTFLLKNGTADPSAVRTSVRDSLISVSIPASTKPALATPVPVTVTPTWANAERAERSFAVRGAHSPQHVCTRRSNATPPAVSRVDSTGHARGRLGFRLVAGGTKSGEIGARLATP